jgi:hypothetical protein
LVAAEQVTSHPIVPDKASTIPLEIGILVVSVAASGDASLLFNLAGRCVRFDALALPTATNTRTVPTFHLSPFGQLRKNQAMTTCRNTAPATSYIREVPEGSCGAKKAVLVPS